MFARRPGALTHDAGVDAISVTTHGACAALIGHHQALAAPILDYEQVGPFKLAAQQNANRPPIDEKGSGQRNAAIGVCPAMVTVLHLLAIADLSTLRDHSKGAAVISRRRRRTKKFHRDLGQSPRPSFAYWPQEKAPPKRGLNSECPTFQPAAATARLAMTLTRFAR